MNKTIIIIFLFSVFMFSCTSSESNTKKTQSGISKTSITQLAQNKYGDAYTLDYNFIKDFVLCKSITKSKIPNNEATKFFIFDLINDIVVLEDYMRDGSVSWYSNYEVKIVKYPGIVKKNQMQEYGYILNVKTNLKTKIDGGIN